MTTNPIIGKWTVQKAPDGRLEVTQQISWSEIFDLAIRCGDWKSVAKGLRQEDVEIPIEVRRFLADVLDGKIVRPNNRAPVLDTKLKHSQITFVVLLNMRLGAKRGAAEEAAMKSFKVDRRTVQRALRSVLGGRKYGLDFKPVPGPHPPE